MSQWRRFVVSIASCSRTDRQRRALSVPPERFWISEASVELPEAETMMRWNSSSAAMNACVVSAAFHLGEAGLERDEVVLVEPRRRHPGRDGLEDPSHLMELEQRRPREQVADETHAGEQELRLEARHVGAVTDARLEHADQRQRANGLAQRVAGEAEAPREVLLLRKLRGRGELARHDQVLDLRDRLIGQRGHAFAPEGRGRDRRRGRRGGARLPRGGARRRPAPRPRPRARSPATPSRSRRSGAPPASRCRRRGGRGRRGRRRRRLRRGDRRRPTRATPAIVFSPEILAATLGCDAAAASTVGPAAHLVGLERRLAEMVDHDREPGKRRGELRHVAEVAREDTRKLEDQLPRLEQRRGSRAPRPGGSSAGRSRRGSGAGTLGASAGAGARRDARASAPARGGRSRRSRRRSRRARLRARTWSRCPSRSTRPGRARSCRLRRASRSGSRSAGSNVRRIASCSSVIQGWASRSRFQKWWCASTIIVVIAPILTLALPGEAPPPGGRRGALLRARSPSRTCRRSPS